MNLLINALLNSYSIVILFIIFVYSVKKTKDQTVEFKLFNAMAISTILLLLFDFLGRFDGLGTGYPFNNNFGNFMLFCLHFVLPSLWFIYVYYQINHKKEKLKKPIIILAILNIILIIITIINLNTGWFYYIDDMNVFHRGPGHPIPALITLAMLCLTAAYVLIKKKQFERKIYTPLVFFAIPPFVGLIIQISFVEISFALNGVVISVLIVFLGIQNKIIHTDYLTDTGNRTKLASVLQDKVYAAKPKKTFSLIIADINDFKLINENHGHAIGDEALKMTAALLKECTRSRDYIFRFGADEFCMILDISDKYVLERLVMRLVRHFDAFNQKSDLPFGLSLSVGFAVYDSKSKMTAEEFLKYVDMLMVQEQLNV